MEAEIKKGNFTIAFFDILGFKEMVNKTPLDEIVKKYEYMISVTDALNYHLSPESNKISFFSQHPVEKPFCTKYIFSDSFILFSNETTSLSCFMLLVYAWKLFQILLASGFSARGAITCGEIYINNAQKIFLGKALISAYELAQKQQWIGASIDYSVLTAFPDIVELIKNENYILRDLFFEYDVPMKDGTHLKMHTLNWRWNLVVQRGTRSLFPPSDIQDVITKQNNSLEYVKQFVSTGRIYMQNQDKIPVELRSLWVGDKEPPFKHGDEL